MDLYGLLEINNFYKEFTEYDIMINKSFRDLLCLEGLLIGVMSI